MDNEEAEAVTGAMDCEQAEVDATDEDVVEISKQGTSHGQMTRKRNMKAAVWRYFSMETDESGAVKDLDIPVCTVGTCGARVKTNHSSTSNLYSHLNNITQRNLRQLGRGSPRARGKLNLRGPFRSHFSLPQNSTHNHGSRRRLPKPLRITLPGICAPYILWNCLASGQW